MWGAARLFFLVRRLQAQVMALPLTSPFSPWKYSNTRVARSVRNMHRNTSFPLLKGNKSLLRKEMMTKQRLWWQKKCTKSSFLKCIDLMYVIISHQVLQVWLMLFVTWGLFGRSFALDLMRIAVTKHACVIGDTDQQYFSIGMFLFFCRIWLMCFLHQWLIRVVGVKSDEMLSLSPKCPPKIQLFFSNDRWKMTGMMGKKRAKRFFILGFVFVGAYTHTVHTYTY